MLAKVNPQVEFN